MKTFKIGEFNEIADRSPVPALVANVDLVVVRFDDQVSVLYGRCHHRGALLADGHIDGPNLIRGVHGWDYRYDTGISEYNNDEALESFSSWIDDDGVWVDEDEIAAWEREHPQPYLRGDYQGAFQDPHGAPEEPHVGFIRELAGHGLSRIRPCRPIDRIRRRCVVSWIPVWSRGWSARAIHVPIIICRVEVVATVQSLSQVSGPTGDVRA